jgi:hypothetical protein
MKQPRTREGNPSSIDSIDETTNFRVDAEPRVATFNHPKQNKTKQNKIGWDGMVKIPKRE